MRATPARSAVEIVSFTATSHHGGIDLRWQTSPEVNLLGFNLYREQDQRRSILNPALIASSAFSDGSSDSGPARRSCAWTDPQGASDSLYYLEAVDMSGQSHLRGPLMPAVAGRDEQSVIVRSRLLGELGSGLPARLTEQATPPEETASGIVPRNAALSSGTLSDGSPLQAQFAIAAQPAVKIMVSKSGWYRVAQPDLLAAGLAPSANPHNLHLYANGVEVPMRVNSSSTQLGPNDSIEFYGVGLDTPVTDTQVYWLVASSQPGKGIPQTAAQAATGASPQNFSYTVRRKDRFIYFATSLPGIEENFFGRVVVGTPGPQAITLHHPDKTVTTPAVLEVALQGVNLVSHQVNVLFNNVQVGAISFNSREHRVTQFQIPASSLQEGDNTVQFLSAGGNDVSLVDYTRLTYAHTYQADNDSLSFTAPGGQAVTVGGFSGPSIRVIDITDASNVQEMTPAVSAQAGTYSIGLQTSGTGSRVLLAFVDSQSQRPAAITQNQPSSWNASGNAADLVIIAYRDFLPSIARLADLRRSQGLSVAVVDVEDVYDEFSYGLHGPQGIKDFLAWTTTHWAKAPRYVLFMGSASYDPRNYMGKGNLDLVPSKLVPTQYLQATSDEWLADFDGDNIGELAIGRLPARTKAEADLNVSKIVNFSPGGLNQAAVFVADAQGDYPISFEDENSQLIPLLPKAIKVQTVNRSAGTAVAHPQLIDDLNQGPVLVNYAGHGNLDVWSGDPSFFGNADASALTNGNRLPLFVVMNCLNGYFNDPGLECLAATLLNAQNGGAIAVWASSGETVPDGQEAITARFYQLLFGGQQPTMGEAARAAKAATADNDVRSTWIFFGDPTAKLFSTPPPTPTPTPTPELPRVQFSSANYNVGEGEGSASIIVTRSGDTTSAVTVDFLTTDGTATQRNKYIPASGTLSFAAGETSKSFNVLIIDEAYVEGPETVNLTLSNPTGGSLGSQSTATLTIIDNDSVQPASNPIDDARFFVNEHYLDFLGRLPDQAGMGYWVGQITICSIDMACLNGRRVGVSAAYFTSLEFQQSGYFVYRFYKAAFGRQPLFAEFMVDRGRVVGGMDLEANKIVYANQFVSRAAFTQQYPTTLTPEQYVDALNTNTGMSLAQSDRDAMVNGLKNGAETRATVLRKVADNQAFSRKEFNPAFVLMQYFGYLRRDPDAEGYQFWLGVMNGLDPNSFQGMTCAFITSREYQERFSPVVTRSNTDCGNAR